MLLFFLKVWMRHLISPLILWPRGTESEEHVWHWEQPCIGRETVWEPVPAGPPIRCLIEPKQRGGGSPFSGQFWRPNKGCLGKEPVS